MSELEQAIAFANRVLDNYFQDPDRSTAVLARQFLRALELLEKHNWLEEKSSWQPIETCPKDGTHFLAVDGNFGSNAASLSHRLVYWSSRCLYVVGGDHHYAVADFTHWQPTSTPPSTKDKAK